MISNVKQLASLTAAGAGALVLAGGTAEAGIIDSGILNQVFAFTNTSNPSYHISTGKIHTSSQGPEFQLRLRSKNSDYGRRFSRYVGFTDLARELTFSNRRSIAFDSNGALPFGATVGQGGAGTERDKIGS